MTAFGAVADVDGGGAVSWGYEGYEPALAAGVHGGVQISGASENLLDLGPVFQMLKFVDNNRIWNPSDAVWHGFDSLKRESPPRCPKVTGGCSRPVGLDCHKQFSLKILGAFINGQLL